MQTAELDLLDVDPFDLIEDEEPFAAKEKVDAAASVAELLERALKVIAEFEESSRRPARKPRPGRKARVTAHLPGQHNQESHGNSVSSPNAIKGIEVLSIDKYADLYGGVQDDARVELGVNGEEMTLTARFFENGDMHVAVDLEDEKTQVLEEMDPESMRQLAYDLEDILAVDETDFEGGDSWDIVADAESTEHGFYVAKDGVGDVRIRPPDAADDDYLEVSSEKAAEFVNALLGMADAYEEHFADDGEVVAGRARPSRRKQVVAHGNHDQSTHGRKRGLSMPKAGVPARAPKSATPEAKPAAEVKPPAKKAAPKKAPAPNKKAEPKAKPEPKVAAPKAPARKRAAPKASTDAVTGHAALAVPPRDLDAMTAANDPRADVLWYRAGDNSAETTSGVPGSFEMSAQMRGGEKMTPETKARVKAIDSVMAESKLPEPILVYRGADRLGGVRPDEAIGKGRSLVGREFTDKAFVSTTTDASHASWFGGTVLRIKVPEGTSAIRMADRKGTERDQQESEILLDRGLTYRVVAQHGRGELKGDWGGAYVLDVEVVR